MLFPVFIVFDICFHGSTSWLPFGWADLTVLGSVLESLDESESLFDVSADWEIVDLDVSQDSFLVDDERSSESDTVVFAMINKNTIVF